MEQKIYSKEWKILLVQTDSLTGELLGAAIAELYRAGASNVQVIATVTKKNRPGHLVTIDVRPDRLAAVEQAVIDSLGVSGWQCLDSTHRHLATEQVRREADIHIRDYSFTAEVLGKQIDRQPQIRPEAICCADLQEQIYERYRLHVPIRRIMEELTLFFRRPEQRDVYLTTE